MMYNNFAAKVNRKDGKDHSFTITRKGLRTMKKSLSTSTRCILYLALCILCCLFYFHANFSKDIVGIAAVIWSYFTVILLLSLPLCQLRGFPFASFCAAICVFFISLLQLPIAFCWFIQPTFYLNGRSYCLPFIGALPHLWLFWTGTKHLLPLLRQNARPRYSADREKLPVWVYFVYVAISIFCALFYSGLTGSAPILFDDFDEPFYLTPLWLLGMGGLLFFLLSGCLFPTPYLPRKASEMMEDLFEQDLYQFPIWAQGADLCLVCVSILHLFFICYHLVLAPLFYNYRPDPSCQPHLSAMGAAASVIHFAFFYCSFRLIGRFRPKGDPVLLAA